jgi:hypothetical protein
MLETTSGVPIVKVGSPLSHKSIHAQGQLSIVSLELQRRVEEGGGAAGNG